MCSFTSIHFLDFLGINLADMVPLTNLGVFLLWDDGLLIALLVSGEFKSIVVHDAIIVIALLVSIAFVLAEIVFVALYKY